MPSSQLQLALQVSHTLLDAAQMLDGATSIVGHLISSSPSGCAAQVCSAVYASVYRNQDYTRKVQLIRWYQAAAAQVSSRS